MVPNFPLCRQSSDTKEKRFSPLSIGEAFVSGNRVWLATYWRWLSNPFKRLPSFSISIRQWRPTPRNINRVCLKLSNTLRIHLGYMWDALGIHVGCTVAIHWRYIEDTLRIHRWYIKDTLRIHWGYIEDTSMIHWGYIEDTLRIHRW